MKKIGFIVLIFQLMFSVQLYSQDKYFDLAKDLYQKGRYEESIKIYEELASLKRHREKAIEGLIANYIKLKKETKLRDLASKLKPENPSKLFVDAFLFELKGQRNQALENYKAYTSKVDKNTNQEWYEESLVAIKRLDGNVDETWFPDSLLKMSETNVILPRFYYGGLFYKNQLFIPFETDTNAKNVVFESKLFKYDKFLGSLQKNVEVGNISSAYFIGGLTIDTLNNIIYISRQQFNKPAKEVKTKELKKIPVSENVINELGLYVTSYNSDFTIKDEGLLPFRFNNKNYSIVQPTLFDKGNKLLFSSNMPGSLGGFDLFMCEKNGNGEWSEPVNLGLDINTPGDEMYPFVWNDSIMFFSSNGRKGHGNFDIYMSYRRAGKFIECKNVGNKFNSSADDVGFTITNKQQGILFSNRNYTDRDQMFLFEIPKIYSKLNLIALNKKTNAVIPNSIVEIYDGDTLIFKGLTDNDGKFNFNYLDDKPYKLKIQNGLYKGYEQTIKPGQHIALLDPIELRPAEPVPTQPEFVTDIDDIVVKKGETYRFNNILFEYGKYNLLPESKLILDKLAEFLIKRPNIQVELSAHADSRSSHKFNDELTRNRANECKRYLIEKGVNPKNLIAKGYGKRYPLNRCKDGVNCSEEEHLINRRVEIKFLNE